MRILITTDCYIPMINGVVTSVLNLESELIKLGHDVRILCPSQNISCSDDGRVYRIGSISAGRIYKGARVALRIRQGNLKKIIDWKPDIIHSQSEFTSFIMAKKIAREVGCPIVHTYHTMYEDYTYYFSPSVAIGRDLVMKFTRRILKRAETVIVPSHKIQRLLINYGIKQSIKVVPTGLNLKKFYLENGKKNAEHLKSELGIDAGKKVFITVGRAAKEKNIEELIVYFKRLNIENTVFVIVGGGPYINTLKILTEKEGLKERIIFTGAVKQEKIAEYYRLGDIFVSASQSETQGLTYIEALASSLPAVCRKDACLEGIIVNGKNGGQYTDFNSFKKWIEMLLGDKDLYDSMAENAANSVKCYSAEKFALEIERIYEDTIKKHKEYGSYIEYKKHSVNF